MAIMPLYLKNLNNSVRASSNLRELLNFNAFFIFTEKSQSAKQDKMYKTKTPMSNKIAKIVSNSGFEIKREKGVPRRSQRLI